MNTRPPIVISTRDYQRLCALLDRQPATELAQELRDELERATLVEPAQLPANVVAMNARLRFRNERSGQDYSVELVYPQEVQGDTQRLSILTPAGAALLGLAVGDAIDWPADGRTLQLRLMDVLAPAATTAS